MVRPLISILILALGGCGSEDAVERRCATPIGAGMLGALDAVTAAPQIHPWVDFDGETIWLAYTGDDADDPSVFDTWVMRLHCDGSIAAEPRRVTTSPGRNEIDPVLAVGADSVALAWISDNGSGVDNIDTVVRAYDFDGAPLSDGDVTVEAELGGVAVTGNAWDPALAALPDGRFLLAGTRVAPGATTFRAYGQRLELDGALAGPSFELDEPGAETHSDVAVATGAAGEAWIAWSMIDGEGGTALSARVASGADVATDRAPLMASAAASSGASLAIAGDLSVAALRVEDGGESDIALVADAGVFQHQVTFGDPGALDHSAVVALDGAGGGAVAYWRNLGGLRNQLVLRRFSTGDAGIALGDAVEVAHAIPAPPYPPAITYVGDGVYFVAWAEGDNPEFYLQGALLEL